MDTITLLVSVISMIATVISTIVAVRAKNEAKRIVSTISIEKDSSSVVNNSENTGVVARNVEGGVRIGK